MTREQIKEGIEQFAIRKETKSKLKKAGLPIPPKPEDVVEGRDIFTEWENVKKKYGGISNIPFNELGDFLDRWAGLASYARWVEAVADIDQTTSREIRDTVKKQLYTIQEGSREARDAQVYTEDLYIEWEQKYLEDSSMYTATKALREGYEQRVAAISREITRRGADVIDTRTAINRGNTP